MENPNVEQANTAAGTLDDMVDRDEGIPNCEPLRRAIDICKEMLFDVYAESDAAALRYQKRHRRTTVLAAVFGTFAVLLAILQLSGLIGARWILHFEGIAALVALLAVIFGLVAAWHRNWLLERHKAERCRLAKFGFLITLARWVAPGSDAEKSLRDEAGGIKNLKRENIANWVEEDAIPETPVRAPAGAADDGVVRSLVEYYVGKRLNVQMDYFLRRMKTNVKLERYTRSFPPLFFFGSVIFALSHFVYDLASSPNPAEPAAPRHPDLSVIFILLAAALPAVGAGVRTIRTAYEFGRNNIRFRAKYVALDHLRQRMGKETDSEAILRDLSCCEQILESEHREWLRLMTESRVVWIVSFP